MIDYLKRSIVVIIGDVEGPNERPHPIPHTLWNQLLFMLFMKKKHVARIPDEHGQNGRLNRKCQDYV